MRRSLAMSNVNQLCLCIVGVLGGCSLEEHARTSVDSNELGITAIETWRAERSLEVRGLDSDASTVGWVRVNTGTPIDEDALGTEISTSVLDERWRTITRETELIHLGPSAMPPQTATFLSVPEVAARLAEEGVMVERPQLAHEVALSTQNCPTSTLMTSPTAYQCCYDTSYTYFSQAPYDSSSWNVLSVRYHNPSGTGCRASNGTGSCSGKGCYFGPLGFARVSFSYQPYPNYYLHVYPDGGTGRCGQIWLPTLISPQFATVNGTSGTSCGCACDGTGRICYDSSKAGSCPQANGLTCGATTCAPGGGSGVFDFSY